MKRLFFQTKIYDYDTVWEAETHMLQMEKRNWKAKRQANGNYVFPNGQDGFPYSVEYYKEL